MRSFLRVLLVTLALAPGAHAVAYAAVTGDGKDLTKARALDKEGAKAYAAGHYADAIRSFEESYRLGGPPFELWNVAKCWLRLNQPERAGEMLERYLATPDLPKEDRDEATKQLEVLQKKSSTLSVTSTPTGAEVTIDGKAIEGRTPITTTVGPGDHTVVVTGSGAPFTQKVEAKYGRAIVVEAPLEAHGDAPAKSDAPTADDPAASGPISLRAALGIVFPKHATVGEGARLGFTAMGTYRLAEVGPAALALGGLFTINGDSWDNRTGTPDAAPGCGNLVNPNSATAFSLFAIGTASIPVAERVRATGIAGLGLAAYGASELGGDLFLPTCNASPGVRPALLLGTELDYLLTKRVRLSAFPLTWQLNPAFDGTRGTPRDASGVWMRFGFSIGAGVDF